MSIRNKLILMLAIPLAALTVIGALGFRAQSSNALDATDALQQDELVQSLNRAIKAIGGERLATAEATNSVLAPVIERRVATDVELAQALRLAEQLERPDTQAVVQEAIDTMVIVRNTGNLLRVRPITVSLRAARDKVEIVYPSQESFAVANAVDIAVDIADRQDSIWIEYIFGQEIDTDLARRLRAETGATELLREQLVDIAPPERKVLINESLAGLVDFNTRRLGIDAINAFDRDDPSLLDAPTLAIVAASHDQWHEHAFALQDELVLSLNELADNAKSRQNLFALAGTLGLFILVGLLYVVYRSVVLPLEDLLVGAERVATDSLPSVVSELRMIGSSDVDVHLEPLTKATDDELGSLVDAFNDVQLTAFDLAVEQARSRRNIAEMFVNLGRRNQKLLQRMLSTISTLEHDEKDPDKLEQLFQLDHMTTRMRRNAESLLVVAGTTTPRQWAKPVPAAEVVRSALAEVQEYRRVDILSLADAPMAGNAVADVTHLLAELLENALQFSDPGSHVNISSRWKDGNYRIVINDQGFGMTPDELAEHNSMIADPPPPDEAPTRFLGLFVVGHLAKRHEIDVELTDATIGGTDARISIPGSLMSVAAASDTERVALPVRGNELDLDAELAKLTIETELAREQDTGNGQLPARDGTVPAEPVAPVAELDQRVSAETTPPEPLPSADAVAAAPVAAPREPVSTSPNQSPAPPAPAPAPIGAATAVSAEAFQSNVIAAADQAPTTETFQAQVTPESTSNEPSIDFGELPELPTFNSETIASAATQMTAPATAPVVESSELAAMGLPQRTPRATLQTDSAVAVVEPNPAATATVAPTESTDVSAHATQVGSAFSAFQSGVLRGEETTKSNHDDKNGTQ